MKKKKIRKICTSAPSQLKAIAEKQGHHVEWLPLIIILMNIGNNYYYQWILIQCTNSCLQPPFGGANTSSAPCIHVCSMNSNLQSVRSNVMGKEIILMVVDAMASIKPVSHFSSSWYHSNTTVHPDFFFFLFAKVVFLFAHKQKVAVMICATGECPAKLS